MNIALLLLLIIIIITIIKKRENQEEILLTLGCKGCMRGSTLSWGWGYCGCGG